MKFDEILFGNSRFDEVWTQSACLHLDDTTTHEKSLEFQIHEFLDSLQEFDLKVFES
jgi:hypothetical protein